VGWKRIADALRNTNTLREEPTTVSARTGLVRKRKSKVVRQHERRQLTAIINGVGRKRPKVTVLSAVLLTVLPFAPAASWEQDVHHAAHNWALRHYARVLEAVLPIEARLDVVARDLKWGVRLRIVPAFDAESAYTLVEGFDGGVTATVTTLSGGSVMTQLKGLHPRHTNTRAGNLPALIKRNTQELTLEQCPALRDIARAFDDLRMPAVLAGALQMDATHYDLISDGRSGTLRLSITAPDPAPVVEWAERLRKIVGGCATR
jgi:hypothetical protein